jgi:hypothetical protein
MSMGDEILGCVPGARVRARGKTIVRENSLKPSFWTPQPSEEPRQFPAEVTKYGSKCLGGEDRIEDLLDDVAKADCEDLLEVYNGLLPPLPPAPRLATVALSDAWCSPSL